MNYYVANWVADDLLAVLVSLCILVSVYTSDSVTRRLKLDFVHMIFMALIAMIMDIHIAVFGEKMAFNIISFIVIPFIPVLAAKVFYQGVKNTFFLGLPALINAILALTSPLNGLIFSLDSGYQRGPGYFIFVFSCLWSVVLLFFKIIGLKKRYNDIPSSFLYASLLFIALGIGVRLVAPKINSTWFSITLAIIFGELMLQRFLSAYDPMTGLRSRKTFESALLSATGIIVFDVDDFKNVNDTYGHLYGDEVLRTVASLIDDIFHYSGVSYRVGGDEFCVLLFDQRRPEHLIATFNEEIKKHHESDNRFPYVSLGYEGRKPSDNRYGLLFEKADRNLYAEKVRNKLSRKAENKN